MHLIFDFDGTLVDSFHIIVTKFNLVADRYQFRKIHSDEINLLRDMTSYEIIKHLKIPMLKIPFIIRLARKYMRAEMPMLSSFPQLPETLEKIHQAGIPLGILTSNSEENVRLWLAKNNMEHLFYFVQIESNFFGKKFILKKILSHYQINPSQAFYVGDEVRDIEAAKNNNVNAVAVTWGLNSEKILTRFKPHFIARKPEDLLTLCDLL